MRPARGQPEAEETHGTNTEEGSSESEEDDQGDFMPTEGCEYGGSSPDPESGQPEGNQCSSKEVTQDARLPEDKNDDTEETSDSSVIRMIVEQKQPSPGSDTLTQKTKSPCCSSDTLAPNTVSEPENNGGATCPLESDVVILGDTLRQIRSELQTIGHNHTEWLSSYKTKLGKISTWESHPVLNLKIKRKVLTGALGWVEDHVWNGFSQSKARKFLSSSEDEVLEENLLSLQRDQQEISRNLSDCDKQLSAPMVNSCSRCGYADVDANSTSDETDSCREVRGEFRNIPSSTVEDNQQGPHHQRDTLGEEPGTFGAIQTCSENVTPEQMSVFTSGDEERSPAGQRHETQTGGEPQDEVTSEIGYRCEYNESDGTWVVYPKTPRKETQGPEQEQVVADDLEAPGERDEMLNETDKMRKETEDGEEGEYQPECEWYEAVSDVSDDDASKIEKESQTDEEGRDDIEIETSG